jgi:hypothetical protein
VSEINKVTEQVKEKEYQLMIEGSTMAAIVSDSSLQKEIANLLILADSVILYRSSPS